MLVVWVKGSKGPMCWTSDGIGFPDKNSVEPEIGSIWYVEKSGTNPAKSVVFLKLIQQAENGVVISAREGYQKQLEWAKRVAGEPLTVFNIRSKKAEEGEKQEEKIVMFWDHAGLKALYNNNDLKKNGKQKEEPVQLSFDVPSASDPAPEKPFKKQNKKKEEVIHEVEKIVEKDDGVTTIEMFNQV